MICWVIVRLCVSCPNVEAYVKIAHFMSFYKSLIFDLLGYC
nr:MAG TPA: hypothetical protein [Caudoviricetes sp.]